MLNGQYVLTANLGEGKTSRVYRCHDLKDPKKKFAVKLLREEYLAKDPRNLQTVQHEMGVLQSLGHKGIVNQIETGIKGTIVKPSGRKINDLVYLMLEYVPYGTMFMLCEKNGAMGEKIGRFFLHQMVDVLKYMHDLNMVHRDLKLENLLLTENLSIKFADFGFAK